MKMRFLDQIPYICEQWAELAARSPSSPFITEEVSGRSFTRQQVDELSARVYGWLLAKEIGTEDFVMIRFPRDARPFIAMLGVWKTGAAFTVVEDNYAPERTEAIRGDCGCRLVIDTASWEEILKTEPAAGYREADPHDACFAIYTSGSTGKPKGVLQEYGKIKLNQASLEANPGDLIDETTCMAETAPLGFIAAVKIFMNALYSGMRLVVFSTDTAKNPVQMNRKFDEYHVNLAFLSPSILRIMTDGVSGSLKTLVTGSEAADGIYFDNVKLINNYGMSEAGFHVAQFVIDRRYDITPIGKPVFGDIQIKKGDPVYHIHIPSSTPITKSSRFDSYKKAYDFFSKGQNKPICFICYSWLLCPGMKNVYPETSNLMGFYNDFDIVDEIAENEAFPDCWRVFGTDLPDDLSLLPAKTTLQKNIVSYLASGNKIGEGLGIIIFDGKKILNNI